MTKSIVQLHWKYFVLLEKDLITIAETIEICEKNFPAYGPRITQLILACGSELDVALQDFMKALCTEEAKMSRGNPTMRDYRSFIADHAIEQFSTARVKFLRSDLTLAPWEQIGALTDDETFDWWRIYNKTKHDRLSYYEEANFGIALKIISALMITICYLSEAACEPRRAFTQIMDWDCHLRLPRFEKWLANRDSDHQTSISM